jgi:hypothetical protein
LAGVGGPRDPTNARGTMTTLLKHQELAEKAQETEMTTSHVDATRPPSVIFFGTLILRSFSLLFVSSFSFFVYRFTVEFSFVQSHCVSHTGRLEQHALAPKFRAEVASRLWAV